LKKKKKEGHSTIRLKQIGTFNKFSDHCWLVPWGRGVTKICAIHCCGSETQRISSLTMPLLFQLR